MGKANQTPLMRQYFQIKDEHPGTILLFRVGDFYETFADDAVLISGELGITLTKRNNGGDQTPLAGFPFHALENYLPKLVRKGFKVAVCEQTEQPEDAKKAGRKIVDRAVTEITTPGVILSDNLLEYNRNNYIASLVPAGKKTGVAFSDISTGEFALAEASSLAALQELLESVRPSEVLIAKTKHAELEKALWGERNSGGQSSSSGDGHSTMDGHGSANGRGSGDGSRSANGRGSSRATQSTVTHLDDWIYEGDYAVTTLMEHFQTHSLKGFGVEELSVAQMAAGALLHYLKETQKSALSHLKRLYAYRNEDFMVLDPSTKRNLELVATMRGEQGVDGTLISVLDKTCTAMGGRLLRTWVIRPLTELAPVEERLSAVEKLLQDHELRSTLREELSGLGDLERLMSRIATGRTNARELKQLQLSAERLPRLREILERLDDPFLERVSGRINPLNELKERISEALIEEPPVQTREGGMFREGFDATLDELRDIARNGKQYIAKIKNDLTRETQIPSLKIGYNKVFGYYIEITNAHKEKVPDHFIRKQTLVNSERYITPELKEVEEKVLSAEDRSKALESDLLEELRVFAAGFTEVVQEAAAAVAKADVVQSFAEVAFRNGYVRPEVTEGDRIEIVKGRHPVVERTLPSGEPFIPNDLMLDNAEAQILLITGPNMAGKSMILRQTGLIVLMAQIGSFVPAERAQIGLVDKIFTRVGASDHLAAGESTFLVEMNEAANILNNATPKSLILLDEVGRGTSTFDGLSIAWALTEYLHNYAPVAAKTLFATHYHELNELESRYDRIRNFHVRVQEYQGKVIFLRKLVEGGTDHSYGIAVADMAGLPAAVIARAKEILANLERHSPDVGEPGVGELEAGSAGKATAIETTKEPSTSYRHKKADVASIKTQQPIHPSTQMTLFSGPAVSPSVEILLEKLQASDPDRMTPIDALMLLTELKRLQDS